MWVQTHTSRGNSKKKGDNKYYFNVTFLNIEKVAQAEKHEKNWLTTENKILLIKVNQKPEM